MKFASRGIDADERYRYVFDPTRTGSTFARNTANDALQKAGGRQDAAQPVIALIPLTPLNKAMRAVMLEDAPLTSLGLEIAILSDWRIVSFAVALRWFRWTE